MHTLLSGHSGDAVFMLTIEVLSPSLATLVSQWDSGARETVSVLIVRRPAPASECVCECLHSCVLVQCWCPSWVGPSNVLA